MTGHTDKRECSEMKKRKKMRIMKIEEQKDN